jgi:hypothetical protein
VVVEVVSLLKRTTSDLVSKELQAVPAVEVVEQTTK